MTAAGPAGRPRSTLALIALGLGTFAMGTTELVVVGVLNLIAEDMTVSISTAGQLVTAYALGISVGAPILTALTTRLGRRVVLWLALAAFVAGNALAAAAASFEMLIVARVLTGSLHGLFVGAAFVVAAGLVAPDRQGRAMSSVIGGIALSTVVGVPVGTVLGQTIGWQAAFVAIVILGAVALVSTLTFIPALEARGTGRFGIQARAATAPRVLAMLGVALLLLGGQFAALTYLAPYLGQVTGISGGVVSGFLLAFGIATALGTFLGGRAADRSATTTLIVANALLVLALGGLYLAGSSVALAVLAIGAWGLVGFGLVPALQLRIVSLAGPGGDFAATLGVSAVNAGIAGGSLVGGWAVASGGVDAAVLVAAVICAVALPATWASRFLRVPAMAGQAEPPAPAPAGVPAATSAAR